MVRVGLAAMLAAAALAGSAAAGELQYLYVWTAGVDGQGDGSDKLVTVQATRKSGRYGKVVHTLSVGGRGELAAFAFVRAFDRADDALTISFEIDFRAPRPGLPRAVVLLDR
jgi:selenium-binding protein 1